MHNKKRFRAASWGKIFVTDEKLSHFRSISIAFPPPFNVDSRRQLSRFGSMIAMKAQKN
jgi:hypothetical protein